MKIIIEEPSSTGKLNKVVIHSLFTCYSVNTPHMLCCNPYVKITLNVKKITLRVNDPPLMSKCLH